MNKTFIKSQQMLARAEASIPLGSQTFSKSKTAYPYGVSPFFIERGQGCQVWDIDGNQYLDFVSGLLSVSIGYCDNDVDNAVIEQLKSGVTFSLPHRLETEVAEMIIDMVPCAEMVRFGKNGSDATSAAIRLARAFTKNEHIAVCGYHGWQDWYIGSTSRDLGVPESTKALTHTFEYNNIDSLKKLLAKNKFAAIIMEPMNTAYPEANFLQEVKALCHQHGALLIFDEMISGFRFSLGGAQELFGVIPDLATFGKGMANGYPISAVVGRADIMMLMEDIFFSGTFAGETLSLAASKAVLYKLSTENILPHIHAMGEQLLTGLQQIFTDMGKPSWLNICGHPSWSFLQILDCTPYSSWQLKSLLLQEMSQRGILLGGGHNLNYAHQSEDIDTLLNAYREVLSLLAKTISQQNFEQVFHGKVLQPLFKVR
ncbi:aminotransferase class III-fold pyridoxal phosphate-dependent enzyme [Colwellia ponticola]|uniref:Aminotransferase class III-fold pyridoxal phosphate-dependent enzyme n=1 Tax=Colwellia ponticola TaxID=2304625 RepID=A0A8H2JLJ3_9GAMM|nr:aminotransferase class III-fold pyridoxal phosphate-dependent enzyme [Colwellia ponticola]TMM44956.1 aminotransferase class III-fold pyridoxal phosphate-dependent enzyme [Colwellia ponticola]